MAPARPPCLATLLGDRTPARGEAELGGTVTAAWFRQDLAQVPKDKTHL